MSLGKQLINVLKHVPLLIGLFVFYSYGFLWTVKPRRIKDMKDLLELFYYDFLKLEKEHVEVVKLSDKELVTISRNPCPILKLTLMLGLDTKYTCKLISETVCKFVLKRIDSRLVFERNYEYIRPYRDGCLEKIYLRNS
ncbi:MAG: hypothetical protein QW369_03790 [Desulfurococcaceae archaeon]